MDTNTTLKEDSLMDCDIDETVEVVGYCQKLKEVSRNLLILNFKLFCLLK